jgi:hypothetical protein
MPNYNATIAEFQEQLDSLLDQRDQLERQISGVKAVIEAIKTLADESDESTIEVPPLPPNEEAGFTDRVRAILKANPALALTAVVIRDEFLKTAPKEDPKILLIHTHNTLKRLLKQEEVVSVDTSAGRGYRWSFASRNSLADLFFPKVATPHPADQLSKSRLAKQLEAERRAVEEMREAGSAVGDPLSLEPSPTRNLRPQERFKVEHTKGK